MAGIAERLAEEYPLSTKRAGASCRMLHQRADISRGTLWPHPLTKQTFGNSIGLSLDEPPLLSRDSDTILEADVVYSLRAGLFSGAGAVVSAMALITEHGPELLWPLGDPR